MTTGRAFFRSSVLGNAFFLAVITSAPRSYLLGLDSVELGVLGEFWWKISLRIDGVHGVASYQAAVS